MEEYNEKMKSKKKVLIIRCVSEIIILVETNDTNKDIKSLLIKGGGNSSNLCPSMYPYRTCGW